MEGGEKNLARNTNAETVAAAARERREQAKQESQRKKEKDKEDRWLLNFLFAVSYFS